MSEVNRNILLSLKICKTCNEVLSKDKFRASGNTCRKCNSKKSNDHLKNNGYYKELYQQQRPERLAKQRVLEEKYKGERRLVKQLKQEEQILRNQIIEAERLEREEQILINQIVEAEEVEIVV